MIQWDVTNSINTALGRQAAVSIMPRANHDTTPPTGATFWTKILTANSDNSPRATAVLLGGRIIFLANKKPLITQVGFNMIGNQHLFCVGEERLTDDEDWRMAA